ncbi:UNVERIFIED_CONTAM: hypothetical protein FKN15_029958 [Acipenser sinensis]
MLFFSPSLPLPLSQETGSPFGFTLKKDRLGSLKRSGSFTKLRESIRRSSEKLVRKLKGVGATEPAPRNPG